MPAPMGTYPYGWPQAIQEAFKEATGKGSKEQKHHIGMERKWAVKVLDIKERECKEATAKSEREFGPNTHELYELRDSIDKARKMIAAFDDVKLEIANRKPETLESKVARLEHQLADVRDMAIKDKIRLQAEIDSLKIQVGQTVTKADESEVTRLMARIQALLNSTGVDLEAQD